MLQKSDFRTVLCWLQTTACDKSGEILQIDIDNFMITYFEELDHGGLTYPSTISLHLFQVAHALFTICISKKYEKLFIQLNNQKAVLTKILSIHNLLMLL